MQLYTKTVTLSVCFFVSAVLCLPNHSALRHMANEVCRALCCASHLHPPSRAPDYMLSRMPRPAAEHGALLAAGQAPPRHAAQGGALAPGVCLRGVLTARHVGRARGCRGHPRGGARGPPAREGGRGDRAQRRPVGPRRVGRRPLARRFKAAGRHRQDAPHAQVSQRHRRARAHRRGS